MKFQLKVPKSESWSLNRDYKRENGRQRMWKSEKLSGPHGFRFQVPILSLTIIRTYMCTY
jgi:hypothetical protein